MAPDSHGTICPGAVGLRRDAVTAMAAGTTLNTRTQARNADTGIYPLADPVSPEWLAMGSGSRERGRHHRAHHEAGSRLGVKRPSQSCSSTRARTSRRSSPMPRASLTSRAAV